LLTVHQRVSGYLVPLSAGTKHTDQKLTVSLNMCHGEP